MKKIQISLINQKQTVPVGLVSRSMAGALSLAFAMT